MGEYDEQLIKLLKDLHSPVADYRKLAATMLGDLGYSHAAKPLIDLLKIELNNEYTGEVCFAVAIALGKLKAKDAVIPLLEALKVYYGTGASIFLSALYNIGEDTKETIINIIEGKNSALLDVAFFVLEGYVWYLEDTLELSVLLLALQAPRAIWRTHAVIKIAEIQDSTVVQHLVPMLADKNSKVVIQTINALVNLHAVQAIPALQKIADLKDNKYHLKKDLKQLALEAIQILQS
jgi:HEAT repeat protein